MPHPHIQKPEIGGGAVGHVRHDEAVRHTPVLLQDHEICEAIGTARLHNLLDRVAAPQDPRVRHAGVGVLRINVGSQVRGARSGSTRNAVQLDLLHEIIRFGAQLRGHRLTSRDGITNFAFAIGSGSLLGIRRSLLQVLTALARLAAQHVLCGTGMQETLVAGTARPRNRFRAPPTRGVIKYPRDPRGG
eukprot:scaffold30636_cov129-Isochrysis_galbana.AAC.6